MAKTEKDEEKPVKVDKWDGSAVKNALDDAVKKTLVEGFGCEESHVLMNGRLVICTIAVAFALFALAWDYLHPFPESRPILIICVLSYFILMCVLTAYTTFKEKGCFLLAVEKDKTGIDADNNFAVSSALKRYDDIYTLSLSYTDGSTNQTRETEIVKSVANYFDENGYICYDLFEPVVREMVKSLKTEKKSN